MNAHAFCSNFETGILSVVNAARNARAQDTSGQEAVEILGQALRSERRRTATLRDRVAELEARLAAAQDAITLLAG